MGCLVIGSRSQGGRSPRCRIRRRLAYSDSAVMTLALLPCRAAGRGPGQPGTWPPLLSSRRRPSRRGLCDSHTCVSAATRRTRPQTQVRRKADALRRGRGCEESLPCKETRHFGAGFWCLPLAPPRRRSRGSRGLVRRSRRSAMLFYAYLLPQISARVRFRLTLSPSLIVAHRSATMKHPGGDRRAAA